jgi:flagellar P-ring protein precursor FlgI
MTSTHFRSNAEYRGVAVGLALALAIATLAADSAFALAPIKTLCRVKGQEENVLQEIGLVVGLKGTGDGAYPPTMRMLAQIMQNLGSPVQQLKGVPIELKDSKNVAMVLVTATVPAGGARQGDKIDCSVSSIGPAKSLVGGELFTTFMVSQDRNNPRVYAAANGRITIDGLTQPTTGRIHGGCRLEEDFFTPYTKDGKFTLVLDPAYVDFEVAQRMAEDINTSQVNSQSAGAPVARAINAGNIEVTIPAQYVGNANSDPLDFVSQVMSLSVSEPRVGPRVVINERAGSIIISGDTEIGPVVVTHKNIVVDTGGGAAASHFVAVDPKNEAPTLKSLVAALNAVRVPADDIIEIIKGLHRDGKLRARLIIQ